MTKRELERIIFDYPDDIRVVMSNLDGRADPVGCGLMNLVPATGEVYFEAENATKDGKESEPVLVVWAISRRGR